ncbi:condensation domain-containing protein [Glycomyces sp. L485]|uniref:condensation domain-containing protein n=1 Tax=Glycomyces sp. L485 TaxID=2909235 RepID=UPI001F4BBB68|nr:condensation domain-containing protein [Glycomyces sp. L485]MCH7231772.1 condensation domain-containing protein [Glycomyces sp. L485]
MTNTGNRDGLIEFAAQSPPRSGPLTAGQRYMWDIIADLSPHDEHLNLQQVLEVPPGRTLDAVRTALRRLIETHESMRTAFTVDAEGEPVQRVVPRGTVPLRVVEAGDRPTAGVAESVSEESAARRFDLAVDLPVRISVVCQAGRPTHVVLAMSHLVADRWGTRVLLEQLSERLADEAASPVSEAWQPLDQVAYEASPDGIAQRARAADFLRSRLRDFPERLFPVERHAPQPERYWAGWLRSAAVDPASQALAGRWGVSASAVLLAAAFHTLHRLTGVTEFGLAMRTFNRFQIRTQQAVGHFAQDIPVLLRDPVRPLEAVARDAQMELRNTMRCTHFWPPELVRIKDEVVAERGYALSVDAAVNHAASPTSTAPPSAETVQALRGAEAPGPRFEWVMKRREEKITFLLSADAAGLSLLADTTHLRPEHIEEYLYALESQLLDHVSGSVDQAKTGRA